MSSSSWQASRRTVVLFIPDIGEPHSLYEDVFRQYSAIDRPDVELAGLPSTGGFRHRTRQKIEAAFGQYENRDSCVTLQVGTTLDERALMRDPDYFATTRSRHTVYRTCLADRYQAKILYGTDKLIFLDELR